MVLSRIERLILLCLGLGLCLLSITTFVIPVGSRSTGHGLVRFRIAYGAQIDCYLSGPGGCGYSYDSTLVVLDYLFWVSVAFAIAIPSDVIRVRFFSKMG